MPSSFKAVVQLCVLYNLQALLYYVPRLLTYFTKCTHFTDLLTILLQAAMMDSESHITLSRRMQDVKQEKSRGRKTPRNMNM